MILDLKKSKADYRRMMQAVDMLKVLGHPLRLSILCQLIHNGEMTAGDIAEAGLPRFSQSQTSQYLGVLRDMGYVSARKEGLVVYYSIKSRDVKKIIETLYAIYCRDS